MTGAATAPVRIGGRRIELLDLPGDDARRPLLLLHEGLGSVALWRDFPADLHAATGRRLVAFSRFGHGRSEPPARRRTPAFFHEEALEVLPELCAQLGLSEPVLVGHSDGGSIALIHAAHHPVSALVLMAPHVFVEQLTVDAIAQTRLRYLDGPLRERMARYHDDVDAAFWGWCDVWLDPAFPAWSIEDEIAGVSAATLAIQGEDDPYGTLEQLDRIQARVPAAQRLVVAGGHSPHLEQGPQVVAAISRFLDGV